MLFNSYIFWAFFAVVFALYRLLSHRWQNYMLLAASYVFYGYWDWRFLFVMLFSTVVDYYAAISIGRSSSQRVRKTVLLTSITLQLGLLGVFKYYGFFSQELSGLLTTLGLPVSLPVLNFLLPVGISFYTFQTMSYTIDVYRGDFKYEKSFIDFALFVSFFPHLVAGPLVRARKLLPQLTKPRVRRPDDFREGLYYVAIGLFKKVVVGDNMALIANSIFHTSPSQLTGLECLLGIYAFAFQIYGDFSGYSSIAQGVARWLNIDLTTNFNLPYLAVSPPDFWARWHISLSTWFRDYVYVPLARRGGSKQATRWRLYSTLVIVMLLSGLWHGAAWTFVLWGLYHGLLLCGYRLISWPRFWFFKKYKEGAPTPVAAPRTSWVGYLARVVLMFHLVCLGWLLFRAESMAQVWAMLGRMATDFRLTPLAASALAMIIFYAGPLVLYEFWLERKQDLLRLTETRWWVRAAAYSYCALMLWFFAPPVSNVFIYFQF
ncbi:MAG TPA: MBOAT family O-acyltransferase [Pyrinomonadaceae bacterium]|jgi:D-alanyl-lipoteichoic acid acyltransferase DltB (MBOAT superfamily)